MRRVECSFRDDITQAKKKKSRLMHAMNLEKILVTTGAKESEVLEIILSQQKKKTTVIHTKNSKKVPVATSANESAV